MEPFVTAAWLAAHADAVVCDVRWYLDGRDGHAAYLDGHLPGAIHVDLTGDLSAPASDAAGRHPLPEPESFAGAMARLGIGEDDTVVAYDDDGGAIAARLVWMLRVTGHEAAVLDGGIDAWDGPIERGEVQREPAAFTPVTWPAERLAGADDALSPQTVAIDARAAERFAGAEDPHDPRSGHIPGARSLPTRANNGPDKRLRDEAALRERMAQAGVVAGADVVSYCGSGVTACHNLLVVEHLGLGPGRLYAGSWSQYSRDPSRPVEVG